MEGMPAGLMRRTTPPDDHEAIYPCSIDSTEALVIETSPGEAVASFSMLLCHQGADESGFIGWETEWACLGREAVAEVVAQLQAWLDTPLTRKPRPE